MCGERTRACGAHCRSCQSARHQTFKRIEAEGLIVDEAGGSWWVWTAKGEVLVIGKDTKNDAIDALASGDLAGAS
jgi:hypothetical protein